MIEIRRLEPSEYDLLKTIEEGFCPDPKNSIAIVAKNGQEIIARALLMPLIHLEGSWIREDWRGKTLAKRMVEQVQIEAKKEGLKKLAVYAPNEEQADYLSRLGFRKIPVTVWVKDLECH